MEVVLQWLDEIDDFVFAGHALWARLRYLCLLVASLTAAAIHVWPPSGNDGLPVGYPPLTLSLASLLAWLMIASLAQRADRSSGARLTRA